MRIVLIVSLLAAIFISVNYAYTEEILHPANNNIQIEYALSATDLNVGDTIIVTRTLVNDSGDTLSNLYWTDNLPLGMSVSGYSIRVNGVNINNYYSGPFENCLYSSYNTFRWVVDLPSEEDPFNHKINPSDSIALICSVVCQNQGSYSLPFRTVCFHTGDHGNYTTGEPITINISYQAGNGVISGTVTDNNYVPVQDAELTIIETGATGYSAGDGSYSFINLQPGIYDLSVAHPDYRDIIERDIQVFNDQTTIRDIVLYSSDLLYIPGDVNGDGAVIGGDVTYAVNYFRGDGTPPPDSVWLESSQSWLYAAADANGSCSFIGSDITYLVNFFRGANDEILYCPEAPPQ